MWEGLAARLEGQHVVLEPLRPEHEAGLYEAALDMDWTWMFVDAARRQDEVGPASAAAGASLPVHSKCWTSIISGRR